MTENIKNKKNQTLTLKDKRKLGYEEYGLVDGFPIFAFHGTPGSRIWMEEDDSTSQELNIRLITIDRPGFGLSDFQPKRRILDFASDIEQLADHLELDHFAVMGISGGGIYAAACAYALKNRVIKAGLISTINEFKNGKPPEGMCKENRMVFIWAKRFPWLLRVILNQQKKLIDRKPDLYKQSIQKQVAHLCPADQEVMANAENAEIMWMHMKEAFRQGTKGAIYEAALLTRKWSFDCADIRCEVEVWHGLEDTLAPVSSVVQLAEKIPVCNTHFIENKGHMLSEDPKIWQAILQSLS